MPPSASGWLHQGAMPQKDLWGNTVTGPLSILTWAEKKAAEKEQKEAAKAEKAAAKAALAEEKKKEKEEEKKKEKEEKEAAKKERGAAKRAEKKAAQADTAGGVDGEAPDPTEEALFETLLERAFEEAPAKAPKAAAPAAKAPAAEAPTAKPPPETEREPTVPMAEAPKVERPPFSAFGAQVPLLEGDGLPLCIRCKNPVDPCVEKVRLLKKSPPEFCCPCCNSKGTIAANLCGKWPVEEFKELSPEEQVAFWNSCVSNKWDMMKAIEKHLVRRVVNQRLNAVEGQFLPLSVWATQGFDTALIEATCPKEMHPNLGPTFQVKIHSTGEKAIEESVREHMAKLILNPPTAMRPIKGTEKERDSGAAGSADVPSPAPEVMDDTKKDKKKKRKRSSSSSSSSSSSTSSSSESEKKSGAKKKK